MTNTGDIAGGDEITLMINDEAADTTEVKLEGHASRSVAFTVLKDVAGTYLVNVGKLSGTFKVRAPATFVVAGIFVQPAQVLPGETVVVTITIKNTGDMEGTYTPVLEINGEKSQKPGVVISPGGTVQAEFEFNRSEPGVFIVRTGSLTAEFKVVARPPTPGSEPASTPGIQPTQPTPAAIPAPSGTSWVLVGVIAGSVFIASALVFLLVKKRA